MHPSRRVFLRNTLAGLAGTAVPARTFAASNTPTRQELTAMEGAATAFMVKYAVPGLSVAIARHGEIVYDQAFGFAGRDQGEKLTPSHRFRIASVSKPFTSVALFLLMEQGRIHLEDVIFGPGGVLRGDFGEPPYKQYVGQIRLKHLLMHTGGGWPNDGTDPMFRNPRMDHKQLITWALANVPLTHPPGEHYAYSNFGYCILGRVIEKVTGQPYEQHVQAAVQKRCGISGMQIAGNTLAERVHGEVVYYGQGNENPYNMNVRRMDSHGGWLATASDLARFAFRVDSLSAGNILKPASIAEMTAPLTGDTGYAKGWQVNHAHNWWHTGSLPGTATIMVRTHSGYCWAALANSRDAKGTAGGALDELVWQMAGKVKAWDA